MEMSEYFTCMSEMAARLERGEPTLMWVTREASEHLFEDLHANLLRRGVSERSAEIIACGAVFYVKIGENVFEPIDYPDVT